jgi:ABC-2 type transport system permease protein
MTTSPQGIDGGRRAKPTTYLVARREVRVRLRSRAFRISTALLMAVVVIGSFAATRLGRESMQVRVAFDGEAGALATPFATTATALGARVTVVAAPSESQQDGDLRAGNLDVIVSGSVTSPTALVRSTLDPVVEAALDSAIRQAALGIILSRAGLDPTLVIAEIAKAAVDVQTLEPENPEAAQGVVLALLLAYFLMYALALYGGFVASGVVEEKATRIVEIILATVRPSQLLAGKVLGIGIVGLVQVGLIGATGLAMINLTHVLTIPATSPGVIALDIGWFLLGYAFYATLFAIGGALVSRPEEVQSVSVLPIMFLVGALLLTYQVVMNPSAGANAILSLVPPFAPVLMPARMAVSDVPGWQVLLAAGLLVLAVMGLTMLAGRIYANSILHIGRRMGLREAIRGAR